MKIREMELQASQNTPKNSNAWIWSLCDAGTFGCLCACVCVRRAKCSVNNVSYVNNIYKFSVDARRMVYHLNRMG